VPIAVKDHRDVSRGSNADETFASIGIGPHEGRRRENWGVKPDLLTLARTSRRALHRMVSLSRLTLFLALSTGARLLRMAMRRFLLMRCMRMVLMPEVLGLLRGSFAISCHEFSISKCDKSLDRLSPAALIHRKPGPLVVRSQTLVPC
jgi:hypothetical protein